MDMRLAFLAIAASAGCRARADVSVVSAEALGTVPRSDWIVGRDGGSSGLAFGRSVWVFGDTALSDPDAAGSTWHTNSYAIADPATWRDASFDEPTDAVGAPRLFVPLTAEETAWNDVHGGDPCDEAPCGAKWALWPGAPIADDHGGAWILYGLYNDAQPSGIGIAAWAGLDQPVVRDPTDGSGLLFPGDEPEFANAAVAHDGFLYAFGCTLTGLSRPCALGRAPLDRPNDRAAWTFYDGAGWSSSLGDAVHLFDGAPIMEVSYDDALGRWLLV